MVLLLHFVATVPASDPIGRAIVTVTNYGSYGVELFFILSGLLITGILYDSSRDPHYFRNFYMRRVLRIFPLYYGVLAFLFFVAPLITPLRGPTLDFLVDRQAWAWLYGVNFYIAKQGDWSFSYLNHFWSLSVEEQFYLFWPPVVFMLARRPRALIAVCLSMALCAMLAQLIGSLIGLSWWTIYTLTPFHLDGLALGAFLAVTARQPGGLERLTRVLPVVAVAVGVLLTVTFVWTRLMAWDGLRLVLPIRAALILILLACLLLRAIIAPERSVTARFFRSRSMVILGTYSYGLYVYHHFIAYYLVSSRTDLELAGWLGSHEAAVALQATLGISVSLALAYLSYELFEKRFLRLKRLFTTATEPAPKLSALARAAAAAVPTKADIQAVVAAAVPSKAEIQAAVAAAVPSKAEIQAVVAAAVPSKADIQAAVAAAVPSKADIQAVVAAAVPSKAEIQAAVAAAVPGKADIQAAVVIPPPSKTA